MFVHNLDVRIGFCFSLPPYNLYQPQGCLGLAPVLGNIPIDHQTSAIV